MAKKSNPHQQCAFLTIALGVIAFVIGVFASPLFMQNPSTTVEGMPTSEVASLVSFVDEAALLVTTELEDSFVKLREKDGEWWKGDRYIFVYDMKANTLVLPPTIEVEGTNRWNTKDTNGVFYVREMAQQLGNKDTAWVMYAYPKPNETTSSSKLAYVKKVKMGDSFVFVGSGMYLD